MSISNEQAKLIIGLATWLKASLNCKQHVWEPDQRAAAQELVDAALAEQQPGDDDEPNEMTCRKCGQVTCICEPKVTTPDAEQIVADAAKKLLHSNADYRWEEVSGVLRQAIAQAREPLVRAANVLLDYVDYDRWKRDSANRRRG